MRVVIISDTHSQHRKIQMPDGDVLICAGDITFRGELKVIQDFANWIAEQPYKHKLVIFGNHEVGIENGPKRQPAIEMIQKSGAHYLEDSGIELDGIKYWGSPITPFFFDWEWNRNRGADIARHWAMIPVDTTVLITHGPPYMILDEAPRGFGSYDNVGCADLLRRIAVLKDLKLHCFGHIHNGYSAQPKIIDGVAFVNAAICDERNNPTNQPIVIDL
jgi:Icc-related predicted phosphoesterase